MIDKQEPAGSGIIPRFIRTLRKNYPNTVIGREGHEVPYLERTLLFEGPFGSITLHRFRRNDADVPHDHSFDFLTLILKGGYREERFRNNDGKIERLKDKVLSAGHVAFRRTETIHRVHVDGGEGWTLVIRGPKRRAWSFWPESGAVLWWEFLGYAKPDLNPTERWIEAMMSLKPFGRTRKT